MKRRELQPEGNYYDKYHTKNKIEQWLMKHFFRTCEAVLDEMEWGKTGLHGIAGKGSVLEAGCGEGEFTKFLHKKYGKSASLEAFDISRSCVAKAQKKCPGVSFHVGSIYEIPKGRSYDLVVASEVLEHMDDPALAVQSLLNVCQGYLFLTVPNEPLWRILNMARGKYLGRLGNTPGHVQHWNKRSFQKLVLKKGGGKTELVKAASACPWIILLVRVKE